MGPRDWPSASTACSCPASLVWGLNQRNEVLVVVILLTVEFVGPGRWGDSGTISSVSGRRRNDLPAEETLQRGTPELACL